MAMPAAASIHTLSRRLRRFAAEGPVQFRRFLAGDEFKRRFDEVPPSLRRRAVQAVIDAERFLNDPLPPPVKAAPLGASKKRWGSPAALAKLKAAYAKAGNNHEMAARLLRVTPGAARLAKRTYLDAPAAAPLQMAA